MNVIRGRRIIVEIEAMEYGGFTSKRAVREEERRIRDDIDRLVRDYFRVGRHSKAVRTRLEPRNVTG